MKNRMAFAPALWLLTAILGSQSQAFELKDAVESTIVNNPDVRLKLHQFQSSVAETGLGRAGFLPVADISYTHGRELSPEDKQGPEANTPDTLKRWGWSANLTQNLFNGFQSVHLVQQLEHAQSAQYFQFIEASEQQGLEGARAYLDVLRYRRLLLEAENNFSNHRTIYQQLQRKVSAGVGRGVDLEQASGRLALAESNLLTTRGNLDDVTARYARVTGSPPPSAMQPPPALSWSAPQEGSAFETLLHAHPNNRAAREGVRVARLALEGRRGAFMPTVDARARHEWGSGVPGGRRGAYDRKMIELVSSFNLTRGGADKARLEMAAQTLNQALDQRDKSCRETRQSLTMAGHNVSKLTGKIPFLLQHALASEKVRDAYRQQFDIGQRSLLDLLDSENELFVAKSAAIEGQSDLDLARLSGLALSGRLLSTLQLKPLEQINFEESERDAALSCASMPSV
jgi:adhesin transport system outer membrane protein